MHLHFNSIGSMILERPIALAPLYEDEATIKHEIRAEELRESRGDDKLEPSQLVQFHFARPPSMFVGHMNDLDPLGQISRV